MDVSKPLRIVVVDDSHDAADSTAEMLSLMGYEIAVAYSGQEALQHCSKFSPDMMLIDIGMPEMNGNQLAELIRGHEGCRETFLIAISGYHDENHKQLSKKAGFDLYLIKPVDPRELLATLEAQSKRVRQHGTRAEPGPL